MNLPNKITTARLILVPVFIACFYLERTEAKVLTMLIFVIASVTDFFDGYIARKQNLITNYGKVMDQIADKVLVCTALILMTESGRIPAIVTIIFIARDLLVGGIRVVAAKQGTVIAAGIAGKIKTAVQMFAMILFLLFNPKNPATFMPKPLVYTAHGLLWLSVLLALISAYEYVSSQKELFRDR